MGNEQSLLFSRVLTELTLSFHIIFATIGVGVPLLIMIAQWAGIKKQDEHYILLARRWTRGYAVTVAVGVVTGTIIGLQLSLLWPTFMRAAGNIIALPLFMETFAFFLEAIFLGIYLYTWDRFENQRKHLLLLVPVAIGAGFSAVFITIVNAFMNTPRGFAVLNGELVNIKPLEAMFNPAVPTKAAHVLLTAFMTASFILASIAAFHLLRGSNHAYHKKALLLTMKLGAVFAIASAVLGDFSGKFLAEYQPEKLAAAEWHLETTSEAPLVMFGVLDDDGKVRGALTIPFALSILAFGSPNAEVAGLDQFPVEEHPPLYIHYLFDSMVIIGVFLMCLSLIYLIGMRFKWKAVSSKWFTGLIVLGGPLAIVAIEAGWWFTEVGRQPWILRGVMKTAESATVSPNVDVMLYLFTVLYVFLAIGCVGVLLRMFKKNPIEKELSDRALLRKGEMA